MKVDVFTRKRRNSCIFFGLLILITLAAISITEYEVEKGLTSIPKAIKWSLSNFYPRPHIFIPSNIISPSLASIIRLIHRRRVDFPAPDGPMMETNSQFSTCNMAIHYMHNRMV